MATLVLRFVADAAEKGAQKQIECKLIDPDGKEVANHHGQLQLQNDWPPGEFAVDLCLPTHWLTFKGYGPHRLVILVNGEPKNDLELMVAPPPAAPGERNG